MPVLAALALRRWAVAAVAALAAVALGLAMVPRAVAGPQPGADGPRLVVMTSNLWLGQANADWVLRVRARARRGRAGRAGAAPAADGAPRRRRARATRAGRWCRRGAAGSACWRAAPWTASGARTCGSPCPARRRFGSRPRIRARPSTAPPHPPGAARSQRYQLGLARRRPILAGDFNAVDHPGDPRAAQPRLHRRRGRGGSRSPFNPTWPTPPRQRRALPLTIDHVLVNRRMRVERVTIVQMERSDHRAVIAELRLPSAR